MNDQLKDECVICYEDTFRKNKCGHTLCGECFQNCLNRYNIFKCPICRIILVDNATYDENVNENITNENATSAENDTDDANTVNTERVPRMIQHFDSWLVDRIIADTDNLFNMRMYLKPIRGLPFLFNFETCNHGIRIVSVKHRWIVRSLAFSNTLKKGDVITHVNNESALTVNLNVFRNSKISKLCHILDRELFERFLTENV